MRAQPSRRHKIIFLWTVTLALAHAPLPVSAQFPSYFSPPYKESGDIGMFKKWLRVLNTHPKDMQREELRCKDASCVPAGWKRLMENAGEMNESRMIRFINEELNKAEYITDLVNWGMEDYWATPLEFLTRNGDCEDYAIAKYMTLRRLGIPASKMRIVVLQDMNLGIPHAILVVDDGGKAMVLDNYIPKTVEAARIKHYKPIYAINEDRWWRH